MNTKNLLVSLCTLAFALFLVGSAAAAENIVSDYNVVINGMDAAVDNAISVVAGEKIYVEVYFTADVDDTDVTLEAELEGEKIKSAVSTSVFDVRADHAYSKVLSIEVPYELKDEAVSELELNIEIDGKEYKTNLDTIYLDVQRPSYNADIKSVTVPSSIEAGETFSVEVVLTNIGYNELEDVYVTAEIVGAGISQGPKWLGDLVSLEDDDNEDTVKGTLYLEVPYEVAAGAYELKVTVENDDLETVEVKNIVIGNDYSSNVIVSTTEQTVAKGEDAAYDLLIVNPTNNVKVYKIVSEGDVSFTNTIVAIPAGSSKVVSVTASSAEDGVFPFTANVISNGETEESVSLQLTVEGTQTNSVVVLTIVLAIIFLVLLVVLIVLLGKKPQKAEDFGESYY